MSVVSFALALPHCHVNDHITAGIQAFYQVEPAPTAVGR
jgi:hypothetical protein